MPLPADQVPVGMIALLTTLMLIASILMLAVVRMGFKEKSHWTLMHDWLLWAILVVQFFFRANQLLHLLMHDLCVVEWVPIWTNMAFCLKVYPYYRSVKEKMETYQKLQGEIKQLKNGKLSNKTAGAA